MSSSETVVEKTYEEQRKHFPNMNLTMVPPFYNHPDYIRVMSENIKSHLEGVDYDHILFSYHGIPERHIRKSDITKSHCKIDGSCCATPSKAHEFCYRHQCLEVTRLVAEKLELKEDSYSTSFQSRLGFDPWLQPYTDRTIERLGISGVKNMAIVTPAFVSDCLETLEEIAMEGEEIFHEVGGKEFSTIPCLNDDQEFVDLLANWINDWVSKETVVA